MARASIGTPSTSGASRAASFARGTSMGAPDSTWLLPTPTNRRQSRSALAVSLGPLSIRTGGSAL